MDYIGSTIQQLESIGDALSCQTMCQVNPGVNFINVFARVIRTKFLVPNFKPKNQLCSSWRQNFE